jgi:CheY-like chemotaxis protein
VSADPGQLEQVLVNLAVNARDAMPRGGRLLITTDRVELDEELGEGRPGSYVRLSVSDTGCGMTPDVAAKAFDPFYTTKPAGEGTGLGLATVYGIVSDVGGMIRIYSEPDVGTTFKVDLPAHRGSPADIVPARSEMPRGASQRVLVVEDEDGIRRVAHRILTQAGYRVELADTPAHALELISAPGGHVDLLMTDVVMPGMLGPELVAKARELRPSLPVLYMSGYIHQIASQVSEAGPAGVPFVEKPFTAETLLTAVRDALVAPIA